LKKNNSKGLTPVEVSVRFTLEVRAHWALPSRGTKKENTLESFVR